jgi:hypothetical protein
VSSPAIVNGIRKCTITASDGRNIALPDAVFEAISDIMFRYKTSGRVTLHFKAGHFAEVETETRKTYK